MNSDFYPPLKLAYKKLLGYRVRRKYHNPRVNHQLGVIFIHIPKTAGNSITTALNEHSDPSEKQSPKIGKHAKAWEVRFLLGEEQWQNYFSFAFVRNPWDLMVSSYHWWLQKAIDMKQYRRHVRRIQRKGDFKKFIRSKYGRCMINERYGNLFDWISDYSTGEKIVDYVGRVETLQQDWEKICKHAGMEPGVIGRLNATRRSDYRDYYDNETRGLVAKRFYKIIDMFGYEF